MRNKNKSGRSFVGIISGDTWNAYHIGTMNSKIRSIAITKRVIAVEDLEEAYDHRDGTLDDIKNRFREIFEEIGEPYVMTTIYKSPVAGESSGDLDNDARWQEYWECIDNAVKCFHRGEAIVPGLFTATVPTDEDGVTEDYWVIAKVKAI